MVWDGSSIMSLFVRRPTISVDSSEDVFKLLKDMKTRYRASYLWPFILTRAKMESGSRQWILEIRPFKRWSVTVSFMWKA